MSTELVANRTRSISHDMSCSLSSSLESSLSSNLYCCLSCNLSCSLSFSLQSNPSACQSAYHTTCYAAYHLAYIPGTTWDVIIKIGRKEELFVYFNFKPTEPHNELGLTDCGLLIS